MKDETCASCVHYELAENYTGGKGLCRCGPPAVDKFYGALATFPVVEGDMKACGQWSPNEEATRQEFHATMLHMMKAMKESQERGY